MGVNYAELSTGAIIGTAFLCNVNEYEGKAEFGRNKNKHYVNLKKFGSYKYGFIVKNSHRFRTSILYPGKLGFFEVD